MRAARIFICFTLMALIASNALADEKKGKGKRRNRKPTPTQRFVGKLELTAEQKEKVAAIDKEFAEQFKALAEKRDKVITEEQKKAQRDAQKAAKEAGKKPAEARKSVQEALKLTDEQKTQMKALTKSQNELNAKIMASLKKVLTEEQQAKLPKMRQARGKKAEGGKKKKKANADK